MSKQTAIIIGAGPAGLTAAFELLTRTEIRPIVLERSTYMGGISRTINYKGNRMDLGGHRFFSKNDRVMSWWLGHLPALKDREAAKQDLVMLTRSRKSRIYYLRKFFDYPIQLKQDTLIKLGLWRTVRIGLSYMRSAMSPHKKAENLEQFFINRFGLQLYLTFFKSYTEKIWGVPCNQISAEWGAQRIKGLSVSKALIHYLKRIINSGREGDVKQPNTETSLIEQFLYPKFGPGQMWEEVARQVIEKGGEIIRQFNVTSVEAKRQRVLSVSGKCENGCECRYTGDYLFSTTSVNELVSALGAEVPVGIREIAEGLQYRNFITVGLLLTGLKISEAGDSPGKLISDNWIYLQDSDILAGRVQIFNNWSPYMVSDHDRVWLGVEYFCDDGDELWCRSDKQMARLATEELDKIGIINKDQVLDFTVARMPKAYPGYFGAYERFGEVRKYLDGFENLFLIGRNGMHKYNNQDHSMLTAMVAVDNIVTGQVDKSNVWEVNTEMDYHEAKQTVSKYTTA